MLESVADQTVLVDFFGGLTSRPVKVRRALVQPIGGASRWI